VPHPLVFGLDSFGDTATDATGRTLSHAQTIRDIVDQARLADQLGLYGFSLGEHHRDDFAVSAPDTVLAGIATVTSNLRLGTAVTILSTDDPVRVYERFATLQALSAGRAEITVGRGSYLESFRLFGYDPDDAFRLFDERVELFAQLLENQPVTWSGETRSALTNQNVYPATETPVTFRYAVGGSPESAIRAAKLGAQLSLSVISGDPTRFAAYVQSYRDALRRFGHPLKQVSVHGPGFIAATDDEAIDAYWPAYDASYGKISRERGKPATDKDAFVKEVREGALYVGNAQTVAAKIARTVDALKVNRFDFKYSAGPMAQQQSLANIEAYATDVAPRVRQLLLAAA
jgi:probable LLM family oxidoreductase